MLEVLSVGPFSFALLNSVSGEVFSHCQQLGKYSYPLFDSRRASEALHFVWYSLRILLLLEEAEFDIRQFSCNFFMKLWSALQSLELSKALVALTFFGEVANNFSNALLQIIPCPMEAVQACLYYVRCFNCSIGVTLTRHRTQATDPILMTILFKIQSVLLGSSGRPPPASIISLGLTCKVLNARAIQVPVTQFGS